MNKEREYWTTIDLARAAGVTDARIRQVLAEGKLLGEKLADRWLIRNEEALRWLEARDKKQ